MRTRIALDLHDDIGASLSSISLLGDVERRQRNGDSERLDRIIALARNSVESMSDIVWSINPAKDTVQSLGERMQDVAETAGRAADIEVGYACDEKLADRTMNVHARRNALLLFKEAVNNAVKHSGCRRIDCALRRSKNWLDISICDDGRGFDTTREFSGNGVRGMQRRARDMGWDYRIESSGAGTEVHVRIPLER
jgi:signal transduction histidine kinase